MARTADAVVIEVEARLNQAATKAAEGQFDQSMNKMVASAGKAENAIAQGATKIDGALTRTGNSSKAASALFTQLTANTGIAGDALAALATRSTASADAIATTGARAAQTSTSMGGTAVVAGRLAGVMGGFLGIAITGVVAALVSLIFKEKEHAATLDELLSKMREQRIAAELTAQANGIWERSLDGLIAKSKQLNDELNRRSQTPADVNAGQLDTERQSLATYTAELEKARTELKRLTDARTAARQARATALASLGEDTRAERNLARANGELRRLEPQIVVAATRFNEMTVAAAKASDSVGLLTVEGAKIKAGQLSDPIKMKFDALRLAANETIKDVDKLAARLLALDQQEEKARKAAKPSREGSGFSGGQMSAAGAKSFALQQGWQVNSAQRPSWIRDEVPGGGSSQERLYKEYIRQGRPADRPVAAPGTSAHEGAKGRWALDIQLKDGLTANAVKKAFADEGISVSILKEHGGRVAHVTGSRSQAVAADNAVERDKRDAERQALAAKEAAQRAQAQTDRFNIESKDLQDQLKAAQVGRVTSLEQQYYLDQQQIIAQHDGNVLAYQAAENQERIAKGSAALLSLQSKAVAEAQLRALHDDALREQSALSVALNEDALEQQVQARQREVDEAKTGRERLAASLRLLEAENQLERLRLERIISETEIGEVAHEEARRALARLNADKARAVGEARKDPANKGPGERYRDQLNDAAAQIDESIQQATVDGLKALEDGLVGVIMGTESVAEAFENMANEIIKQLVRIAIQQLIIKPLADALFGPGATGTGGGGGGGGIVGGLIASLFGAPKASGGTVSAGTIYPVGERGPELFMPSQAGTIIPNHAMAALGGGGQSAPNITTLTVNAPGATAETVSMIRRELMAAAPTIIAASQRSTIAQMSRTRT